VAGATRFERRPIEKSLQDESFRQRLLAAPKAAVEEKPETRLPDEVQVRAVDKTPDTVCLVLPSTV
jgi:hypothetical protein